MTLESKTKGKSKSESKSNRRFLRYAASLMRAHSGRNDTEKQNKNESKSKNEIKGEAGASDRNPGLRQSGRRWSADFIVEAEASTYLEQEQEQRARVRAKATARARASARAATRKSNRRFLR